MPLAGRKTTDGFRDCILGQILRVIDRQALNHFSDCRTARERRRAAVSEKTSGFNPSVIDSKTQSQPIAADRICFLDDDIGVGKFSRIARMSDVILEDFGVGHSSSEFDVRCSESAADEDML